MADSNHHNGSRPDQEEPDQSFTTDAFVAYWNQATSPRQVAQHFIITVQAASNKATRLRNQGYILKKFKPTNRQAQVVIEARLDLEQRDLELAMRIGKGDVAAGIRKALLFYEQAVRRAQSQKGDGPP